jgi:hypothetical protein
MSSEKIAAEYLTNVSKEFRKTKQLADRAIAQVSDHDLFEIISPESNSIAIIMKHLAGNMRSRWTDFLTSDGEKPDRQRDTEFIIETKDTKDRLLEFWEAGWRCLFSALDSLKTEDVDKTVYIRNEPQLVLEAINRQIKHYAYHVGQIVFLARYFAGEKWQTLSIPKGKSEEFNQTMQKENKMP